MPSTLVGICEILVVPRHASLYLEQSGTGLSPVVSVAIRDAIGMTNGAPDASMVYVIVDTSIPM